MKRTQFDSCDVQGGRVYILWEDERFGLGAGGSDLLFNILDPSTGLFTGEMTVPNGVVLGTGEVKDFRLVVANDGLTDIVYVLVSTDPTPGGPPPFDDELYLTTSTDAGATFGAPVLISPSTGGVDVDAIALAARGMAVYIAWHDNRTPPGNDVFFQRSLDAGATLLGRDIQLDLSGAGVGDARFGMDIDANALGTVAVTWNERVTSTTIEELRINVSTDGGATFNGDTLVGMYVPGTDDVDSPAVAVSPNDNIMVAWADDRLTGDDVYVATSIDSGVTYAPDVKLSVTEGGRRPRFPRVIGDGGTDSQGDSIGIVWISATLPNVSRAAASLDGGVTWKTQIDVSDTTGDADFSQVAFNRLYNNFIHAWRSDDDGTDHLYAGGYRPQSIEALGFLAGPTMVNFDLNFFSEGAFSTGIVLISLSPGDTFVPAASMRNVGLTTDALFMMGLAEIGPGEVLNTPLDTAGSGSTPFLPLTLMPGFTLYYVGVELFSAGPGPPLVGKITDRRQASVF